MLQYCSMSTFFAHISSSLHPHLCHTMLLAHVDAYVQTHTLGVLPKSRTLACNDTRSESCSQKLGSYREYQTRFHRVEIAQLFLRLDIGREHPPLSTLRKRAPRICARLKGVQDTVVIYFETVFGVSRLTSIIFSSTCLLVNRAPSREVYNGHASV